MGEAGEENEWDGRSSPYRVCQESSLGGSGFSVSSSRVVNQRIVAGLP